MRKFLPHSIFRPSKPDFSRFFGRCTPFVHQQVDVTLCCGQSPAEQRRHLGLVITSDIEDGLGFHFRQGNKPGFAQIADALASPQNLFNQLALLQAGCIARMPSRAAIDCRTRLLRSHMLCHLQFAQRLHQVDGVVAFICIKGAAALDRRGSDLQCRFSFPIAGGLRRFTINHQAVPVIYRGVSHVTQVGFVARALLEELRLIIGCRGERFIAALLAFEVHRQILAAKFGRLARAVLGNKALHRGLSFNQCPGNRKLLMQGQLLPLSLGNHCAKELTRDVFGKELIPVHSKAVGRPSAFILPQANKPAVQQVVFNMLHQPLLRTDGIWQMNYTRTQQTLCRNAGALCVRVQLGKRAIHRAENPINRHAQFAQRLSCRNPHLQPLGVAHRVLFGAHHSHLIQTSHDNPANISLKSFGIGF